jgi:hypothetical protein
MTAMLRRGVLRAFDSGAYIATVEMADSVSAWLAGIAVSRALPAAELVAGRKVAVAFFDAANPGDAVLFAIWT